MKNVLTIVKKEFSRFFKDRRMVITVFLPGILIYVLYSIMGSAFSNISQVDKDYKPTAYLSAPAAIEQTLSPLLDVDKNISENDAKTKVADGSLDIAVIFPANFEEAFDSPNPPEVKIYYNSANDKSYFGYNLVNAVLEQLNKPAFTVNSSAEKFDLAEEKAMVAKIMSTLVPMLMFALLASACMAVAPESIAGEKERGTMATMLITPIKRAELAIGKILSLSCFALLSGISSFLGVILSLPQLMSGMVSAETAALYSVGDYFLIFGIIISTVLVIISAFSVLSAYAKSVKEASSLITPLMMVIILLGMVSMFFNSAPPVGLYLVPLLGSGLAMSSIMSFTVSPLGVGLAILSNLIAAVLFVVLLAFMFKSEKIMFKK